MRFLHGSVLAMKPHDWITPDWPVPANVRSLITTRNGGVSLPPWHSLNLGMHVGDDPLAVAENRRRLVEVVGAEPIWLNQVHGNSVVNAEDVIGSVDADAIVTFKGNLPCVIMVADCLPVLFCDEAGTRIGAAHAGWRGLAGGVLENTVKAMNVVPEKIMAYFGPAIGPDAFEVGAEVREAFLQRDSASDAAFHFIGDEKYLADIFLLARQRLLKLGVTKIYGGGRCTVIERERFFSHRRDKKSGRMAALIWLE